MTWSARAVALEGVDSPLDGMSLALLGWASTTVTIEDLDGPFVAHVTLADVLAQAAGRPFYSAEASPAWVTVAVSPAPAYGAASTLTVLRADATPADALAAVPSRS